MASHNLFKNRRATHHDELIVSGRINKAFFYHFRGDETNPVRPTERRIVQNRIEPEMARELLGGLLQDRHEGQVSFTFGSIYKVQRLGVD